MSAAIRCLNNEGPVAPDLGELRLERARLLILRALGQAQPGAASWPQVEPRLAVVERALAAAPEGRDRRLAQLLELGADEIDFLWFAIAVTADPLAGPHAVALGGADARRGATLALYAAATALPPPRLHALAMALGPAHPFLRYGLLEPGIGEPVAALTPLRAARRLICHLVGGRVELDDALAEIPIPAGLQLDADGETARRRLAATIATGEPVLLVINGRAGAGRRTLAASAARAAGRTAVLLDLERMTPTAAGLQAALLALRREHLLSGALPVIAGLGDLTPERDGVARRRQLERFMDDVSGPVIAVAAEAEPGLQPARPVVAVDLPLPGAETRRGLWRRALGPDAEPIGLDLDGIAVRYRIPPGEVTRVVDAARLTARGRAGSAPTAGEIYDCARAATGQRLRGLAERVEVTAAWQDLVLAGDVRDQVDELVNRVKHAYQVLHGWRLRGIVGRGGGVAALFTGPPGTGKTMAAGLIARALDLELYQVDLSAVVSKWIGETEKNLSRLFDAADAGHALLLFDEADSLFAKRTEVRGSNDRWANLEVNHLLQRIEAFGGVAILTTNMDANIDPAVRRRLAAKIDFDPPDELERRALWTRLLTGRAPCAADVDPARLARCFPALTGGTIRNAVVAAAFRAAAAGSPVTQALLERAAADQYRATGRIYMEDKR